MKRVRDRTSTSGARERSLILWLFVLAATFMLIFQEGAITGYDGQTMYEVTRSIVERRTLTVSDEFNTLRGADGRAYSRYGLGLSLVAAVPYLVVRPVALASSQPAFVLEAAVASAMAFVVAVLTVALYQLARRIGAGAAAASFVAVGAVAGTFVLPYSKEFFSEPLTALCLVIAIERLLAHRSGAAGFALGAAVLVRAQSILFAPVVLLVAWRQSGLRAAARVAAAAAPGIGATLAYNVARFGHPLSFGYEDVGFTTPLLTGLGGLLFEPRKSVLLFAPISFVLPLALVRLWRSNRTAFTLIAGNFVISLGVVTTWFAWHGGWCWGPRLIIPGLVPAIAAVGPWLERPTRWRAAALLFTGGFLVSLPAMLVSTQAQQLDRPPVSQSVLRQGHAMPTQPLASPYPWRQLQLVVPTARYSVTHRYQGLADGRNYLRYLSLWQVGMTRSLQLRGQWVSLALTSMLVWLVVVAWRKVRAAL